MKTENVFAKINEGMMSTLREGPKPQPLSRLRSLVSRQDENENKQNLKEQYDELRQSVITLFENPHADV